jgi:hypothetical protein
MRKINELFKSKLSPLGFVNSKDNFFLVGKALTVVLNLQKSNYDHNYFINIGIWLGEIGGQNEAPRENLCHVRFRADSFLARKYPDLDLNYLLYMDSSASEEKSMALAGMVAEYVVPLLENIRTIGALRKFYLSGGLTQAFISPSARRTLSEG